ncbi:MAG: class I SAM-dependent methyltransferase, partial [Acidimicrobiales bacterium]
MSTDRSRAPGTAGGAPEEAPEEATEEATEWDGAEYDRIADPQARWGRIVLDRLALGGDETVLDAGCGSGRVTEALAERLPGGRVVALDASASMLAHAERRLAAHGTRIRYVRADLLALEPRLLGDDAPVDAVLSTATFHWVTDHDRLFAALARVMRPGAQLVAQCGGEGTIDNVIRAVRSLGVERAGTWLYATAEATAGRLARAGFADIRTWTHDEPTPFEPGAPLVDFLETVCLREHLATLPEPERRPFASRVAAAMGEPVLD